MAGGYSMFLNSSITCTERHLRSRLVLLVSPLQHQYNLLAQYKPFWSTRAVRDKFQPGLRSPFRGRLRTLLRRRPR